ncbi:MAG TPA: hypothetical protein VKE95_15495 [Burkholderiales bacterium]|nr:hypothetical protein [Burkholderiales bacterium]
MEDIAVWVSSLPESWTRGCGPRVFAAAREAYGSAGRFYHTWDHVLDCVEKLGHFPEAGRASFLALLFHDAVYVAGRKDNEARSAALAIEVLRRDARVEAGELQAVERMILATRDHRLAPGEHDAAVALVLDVDMSVLGAAPQTYRRYAEGVRAEYVPAAASATQFAAGRMAFLSRLLGPEPVFHTAQGFARWERAARENVARELAELRKGSGFLARLLARLRQSTTP